MGKLADFVNYQGGSVETPVNAGGVAVGTGTGIQNRMGKLETFIQQAKTSPSVQAASYKPTAKQTSISAPIFTPTQQLQNKIRSIAGMVFEFVTPKAPAVSKALPESVFKENPAIDISKPVKITPDQKYLSAKQLQTLYPQSTEAVGKLVVDPLNLKANPKEAINNALNSLKEPLAVEKEKITQLFTKSPTISSKVGKTLEVVAGGANILFSPLSALFSAAESIPVLGSVAKLITIPFSVAGETGVNLSNKVIDALPISKEVKNNIKQGVGEISALAAQLSLGKIAEVGFKKKAELVKKYGEKDANIIIEKAKEIVKEKAGLEKKSLTDVEVVQEKLRSYFKEGENEPKDIIGSVIKNKLEKTAEGKDILKMATEAEKQGYKVVLRPSEKATPPVSPTIEKAGRGEIGKEPIVAPKPIPQEKTIEVPKEQLPVGQGEVKVSKLESRIKGVMGQATPEQIEKLGLSTYNEMNKKETISKAAEYVSKNKEEAMAVLEGKKPPPKGLPPESLYIALANLAEGDMTLATKLTSLQATALGQRISILSEINKNSPIKLLSDIYKIREEEFKKRYGKSYKEIKKTYTEQGKKYFGAPKLSDWSSIIKEVRC
jgi:hypothetical protein